MFALRFCNDINTMAEQKNTIIGIDIGAYSIKIAELRTTAKSYSLRSFREFPLSPDPTKDKKIQIIDILRNLAIEYNPDQTRFILGVRQSHVSVRHKQFPFKERFKILRSIPFELEDEVPLEQDEAVFEAKILSFNNQLTEVLAMACPKVFIQEMVDLAQDCGIELELLSIEGIALANLFEDWQGAPPQITREEPPIPGSRVGEIVIEIGHTTSRLLVFSERVLQTVRHIDWGVKTVADSIAQRYGLHHIEALKELQTKAYIILQRESATHEQKLFSDVIQAAVDPFMSRVQLLIYEVQTELGLHFNQGHLLGGGCQIRNLGPYLTQGLEIPFNRYSYFDRLPHVETNTSPQIEMTAAVAIGLAIEGLRRPRNPAINLLKEEFAPQQNSFGFFWETWGNTVKVAFACFALLWVYGIVRDGATEALDNQSYDMLREQATKLAGLKGKDASIGKIEAFIKEQEKEKRNRKTMEKVLEMNSAMDILKKISLNSPNKRQMQFEVLRFKVENDLVEIQGTMASAASPQPLEEALKSLATGRKLEVFPSQTASSGKKYFGYRFRTDRFKQ